MQFPLDKISNYIWEVPTAFSKYMRVPARIYADQKLLEAMKRDETLTQAVNISQLPGLLKYSVTLPDGHLRTDLTYQEVDPKKQDLINEIFRLVPCGVGVGSKLRLSTNELARAVTDGIQWAVDRGYGWDRDASHSEEGGCMKEANPDKVSPRALKRGSSQLGTLGAGNHFLEIARVSEIFNEQAAKTYGITNPDQVIIWVHTGSRGFGHQVATDYIRVMEEATRKYKIRVPARELACAPLKSREAQDYYEAMSCAINWAFINRHIIMHQVRKAFEHIFKQSAEDMGMELVYGMTHNTAKKEKHSVDGKMVETVVHRKGAARAFGPGRVDLPVDYRAIGQPVLLVGTMGTASYLLKGTERGEELSFASTAHGAGRVLSRSGARRRFDSRRIIRDLKHKGIVIKAASGRIVEEEQVSHDVGLAEKVMMSVPMAVAKG
jgi:tRNA-splicing ligase RtcB